ncbi:hypothetical protein Ancab_027983, partial [Ancistrocladus abbreviatus]
ARSAMTPGHHCRSHQHRHKQILKPPLSSVTAKEHVTICPLPSTQQRGSTGLASNIQHVSSTQKILHLADQQVKSRGHLNLFFCAKDNSTNFYPKQKRPLMPFLRSMLPLLCSDMQHLSSTIKRGLFRFLSSALRTIKLHYSNSKDNQYRQKQRHASLIRLILCRSEDTSFVM